MESGYKNNGFTAENAEIAEKGEGREMLRADAVTTSEVLKNSAYFAHSAVKRFAVRLVLLAVAVMALGLGAWADDDDYGRGGDQPATGVARVSLIHGDVSMQRGDNADWTAATLNTPLVRGDQVATGDRSRAEVQLDYANVLRLAASSQATIADLTRTHIQIRVANGYAAYSVFKGSEADVEIDTPNVAVRPLKKGRYRVQVNSEDETEVIVRDGEAEISTPQGSVTVKEGRMVVVRGNADEAEYREADAPHGDDWDRFNKDRDSVIRDAQSWHRTNAYYTGSHDLDSYGRWVYVPGYGDVWQPYQEAGWAPYRTGRWVWEPYYGWTWVSYEPWGWAPYHYGRWFVWDNSWVWYPGPVYAGYRPYWGPAFVTFIGFGHGSGFAFGFGNFGWVPCGPRDYYYPWYGRGFHNVNVVNINVINVHNNYYVRPIYSGHGWGEHDGRGHYYSNVELAQRNPHWRNGISGMPVDQFGRGNTRIARLEVHDGDFHDARVVRGNVPVVPTRDSLHAGEVRGVPVNARGDNTRYFEKRQPPAGFGRFDQQRERVESSIAPHVKEGTIPGSRGDRGYGDRGGLGRDAQPMNDRNGRLTVPNNGQNGNVPDRGGLGRDANRPNDREDANQSNTGRVGGPQVNRGNLGGYSGPANNGGTPMGDKNGRLTVPTNGQNGGTPGNNTPDRGSLGHDTQRMGDNESAQNQTPTPQSGSNSNDRGRNSDRGNSGGWSKFGGGRNRGNDSSASPASGSGSGSPGYGSAQRGDSNPRGNDQGSANQGSRDRSGNSGSSGSSDRGGWNRFPSRNDRGVDRTDRTAQFPSNDRNASPANGANDRGASGNTGNDRGSFGGNNDRGSSSDRGGNNDRSWQRFPSGGDQGARDRNTSSPNQGSRNDRGPNSSGSKPPLELNKPIVREPRSTPSPRNDGPRYEPTRGDSGPRSSPSPSGGNYGGGRSEPRYSPPSGGGGGGAPRGDRGGSGGGGNRGGGNSGGGNKGGGGDKGGGGGKSDGHGRR